MAVILLLATAAAAFVLVWSMCIAARREDDARAELVRRLHQVPDRKHWYRIIPIGRPK